ncbi:hypothetical protein ACH5RR_016245 [Cinchona calisaya]|uniref:AP2/ERF domain-containing protein n=1 Tax=Cinchona calisaya TaxID=153742 RepID=A0ABD2ZVB8_9GENT
MFDLNIDAAVSLHDSACDETSPTTTTTFLAADDSGASSSVVNVPIVAAANDEESNSSSSPSGTTPHNTLKFSILNCTDVIQIVDDEEDEVLMTRRPFPVPKKEPFSLPAARPAQQWLKLSVPEAAVGPVKIGVYNNKGGQQQQVKKKSRRGPRSRSSQYRGVTFYKRTGRWESHIWDCGKQVYLGGFDTAHAAARAYDRAAVKFRGIDADINFHISDYEEDMKQMKNLTKEGFVHILRRQSTGFPRGTSKYRGVTPHKCGCWEAGMGQFLGKKVYDEAAIKCNGLEAVTNFERSPYEGKISMAAKDGGGGDNLDLNLWISPASDGLQEIGDSKTSRAYCTASEPPNGKRLKVESSFNAPDGLITASQDYSARTRRYSGFGPNNEERARKMRPEGIPLPGLSNWRWKMHCDGVMNSMPLFSCAASSGFSTTTTYSTTILSSNNQNKIVHTSTFQHPPTTLDYN